MTLSLQVPRVGLPRARAVHSPAEGDQADGALQDARGGIPEGRRGTHGRLRIHPRRQRGLYL